MNSPNRFHKLLSQVLIIVFVLTSVGGISLGSPSSVRAETTETPALPLVAIHVSEFTQALATIPNTPPTPGDTGFEWWYTPFHYFVIYESLKEALDADGTPFIELSDADIIAGELLHTDGSPKYPIVFSLASEAIHNDEITPLLDFVSAGGFLFMGSSAFTRNPNGTTRSDFVFSDEMGLHMFNASLENWYSNSAFSKVIDHRIVEHIPSGSLYWRMAPTSDDIVWDSSGSFDVWRVTVDGAEVIAYGAYGPLLATRDYGEGRFIYHGAFNPLIGHGGKHSGMYAYTIFREAIEWTF